MRALVVASLLGVLSVACATDVPVTGQIFLRAGDGTAQKLALVTVRLYDEATIRRIAAQQATRAQSQLPRGPELDRLDAALATASERLAPLAEAAGSPEQLAEWKALAPYPMHPDGGDTTRWAAWRTAYRDSVSVARQRTAAMAGAMRMTSSAALVQALPLETTTVTTDADGRFAVRLPRRTRHVVYAITGGGTMPITEWMVWFDPARDGDRIELTSANSMHRQSGTVAAAEIEGWMAAALR